MTNAPCYVTDVVITKTVFALEQIYEAPRKHIASSLQSFLNLPNLKCNLYLLTDMIDLYAAHRSLSIIDCYAAAEAGVSGSELVTFDKKLLRCGGEHVVEPEA